MSDLMNARWKAQQTAALAKVEAEVIISAMDNGEPKEWAAMLRRVAALLEATEPS